MADSERVALIYRGVAAWNDWRSANPNALVDLRKADLRGADLQKADLRDADLRDANLNGVDLREAILAYVNLAGATLDQANLHRANLERADLTNASLRGALLTGADLSQSQLVGADLSDADVTDCRVYGISAWDLKVSSGTKQTNLVITPLSMGTDITVDSLELAQFTYLLLNNRKIREFVDTVSTKAVLILGRFTPELRSVLDALQTELRLLNYIPILLDFERPATRDLTETISTLAHMSRFIVADLTDAKSILQELASIVPSLPSVAVIPIVQQSTLEYGMFDYVARYPWVLGITQYSTVEDLIGKLRTSLIPAAEEKLRELSTMMRA